jgi:glycosyltransferase involved in cell wall biosynthesis
VKSGPIQVFVQLSHGFGAQTWEGLWNEGKIVGINERFAYGYHRANRMGCCVTYSKDQRETAPKRFFRLMIRAILGFDLIHAWRNLEDIRRADIIWTHTESQFLAILFLLRSTPRAQRPKLIAQSVWLFDRWPNFSRFKRRLFSMLIVQADVLTVLSPENLAIARKLFPGVRSELVLYGIASESKVTPKLAAQCDSLKIVSLGSDEHRDWNLLIDSVRGREGWKLKIVSRFVARSSLGGTTNVEIVTPNTNSELLALYEWADLVVLALKPNFHASGITVIQEATLQGKAVICSDAGGLKAYFSDNQVRYVPTGDAAALRSAIGDLAENPETRLSLAQNAQARMGPDGLSSESFVRQHVEISRNLLALEREDGTPKTSVLSPLRHQ